MLSSPFAAYVKFAGEEMPCEDAVCVFAEVELSVQRK
jgi:hypothetical protein